MQPLIRSIFFTTLIAIAALCSACMSIAEDSPHPDALRSESNQTHHFRPVDFRHPEWVIHVFGKNLTLKGAEERIKASPRQNAVVIRRQGVIVGKIESTQPQQARFVAQNDADISPLFLYCTSNSATLNLSGQVIRVFKHPNNTVTFGNMEIRKLPEKNAYSVVKRSRSGEACEGHALEMPFNTLGSAIFLIDAIPLYQRMGMATFVSKTPFTCFTD